MADCSTRKRYSLNLITTLKDGTRVLVRTLRSRDRKDLLKGFAKLSLASRRFRFLSPIHKLTASQVRELTELDQYNQVAIAVRAVDRPGRPGIGVARFVRLEQDTETAEFAITVIDEYQNRGVGSLLLRLLLEAARTVGIRTLRGFVLTDNLCMIRVLEKFGAAFAGAWDNTLRAELAVPVLSPAS